MYDRIYGLMRQAVRNSLPTGVYADNRVLFDALEKDITPTPTSSRAVNISQEMGEPRRMTIGANPLTRMEGFMMATLYDPSGSGDGDQLAALSAMTRYLLEKKIVEAGIKIQFGVPGPANGQRTGSHWVKILRIPVQVDFHPKDL